MALHVSHYPTRPISPSPCLQWNGLRADLSGEGHAPRFVRNCLNGVTHIVCMTTRHALPTAALVATSLRMRWDKEGSFFEHRGPGTSSYLQLINNRTLGCTARVPAQAHIHKDLRNFNTTVLAAHSSHTVQCLHHRANNLRGKGVGKI